LLSFFFDRFDFVVCVFFFVPPHRVPLLGFSLLATHGSCCISRYGRIPFVEPYLCMAYLSYTGSTYKDAVHTTYTTRPCAAEARRTVTSSQCFPASSGSATSQPLGAVFVPLSSCRECTRRESDPRLCHGKATSYRWTTSALGPVRRFELPSCCLLGRYCLRSA
jgi:hypothetical protein